jgi:hypothetical protein
MLAQYEIPVAYSMVALAQKSAQLEPQPFQEILCYWSAFNNIYTTIAERKGYFARFRTQKDGTIRARVNGSVLIPEVEISLRVRDEIDLAYAEFSETLKHTLIAHPNTKFFVERVPIWRGLEIEFDGNGQRLNGVINVRYTIDDKHPVWSPIDIGAYERFTHGNASADDINLLARQLLFLVYTVRNNTFHGGKRADDTNDRQVIENALPLLRMIVEFFMYNTD